MIRHTHERPTAIRLTVSHVLLYVAGIAVVMIAIRTSFVAFYGTGPELLPDTATGRDRLDAVLFWSLTVAGGVVTGIAIVSLAVFCMEFIRRRKVNPVSFYPGHGLAVLTGVEAVASMAMLFYRIRTNDLIELGLGGVGVNLTLAPVVLLTYGWCIRKTTQLRWRFFFGAAAIVALVEVGYFVVTSDSGGPAALPFSLLLGGALTLWLLSIALYDIWNQFPSDYLHWVGIAVFMASYVILLGWRAWTCALLNA